MHFIYILRSKKFNRLYIGYSDNLVKRLEKHNGGLVKSTKPYKPWFVVYYEVYLAKGEALRWESNLKLRSNAWNQLKRRIQKSISTPPDYY